MVVFQAVNAQIETRTGGEISTTNAAKKTINVLSTTWPKENSATLKSDRQDNTPGINALLMLCAAIEFISFQLRSNDC